MKRIVLLLALSISSLSAMEVAPVREKQNISVEKATPIWHLLDNRGTPPLKFLCALGLIKQKEADVNSLNIPAEVKEYVLDLQQRLGNKLCLILEKCLPHSEDAIRHVKVLISTGVDLNKDIDGITPLCVAAITGNKDMIEILINAGANPDIQDDKNEVTPLMVATHKGNKDAVVALIRGGAKLNIENKNGQTALYIAACLGKTDIVNILINSGSGINLEDNSGYTALHIAANKGHKDIVELLIKAGACLDIQTHTFGTTALMGAINNCNKDIVELLLNAGANIDIKADNGLDAFKIAVKLGRNDLIDLFTK